MGILDGMKQSRRRRILASCMRQPRERHLMNFDEAKNVVIYCSMADKSSFNAVMAQVQRMEAEGKKVWVVVFVPAKMTGNVVVTRPNTTVVFEQQLGFWGLPKRETLQTMRSCAFDLFIDTTGIPSAVGQYVALMAKASWRVAYLDSSSKQLPDGVDFKTDEVYDLVLREAHPIDLQQYFIQISKTLLMLTQK